MTRLFIICFFFGLCYSSFSQEEKIIQRCASELDMDKLKSFNQEVYNRVLQTEKNIQTILQKQKENAGEISKSGINPSDIITIPVVVHVLHDGEAIGTGTNISDAQIQSQIDVLNEDFRRLNSDASNTPTMFQSVAADTKIQFSLACTDPNGSPTNGIIRVEIPGNGNNQYTLVYNMDGTINEASTGIKQNSTGWRSDWYLNIWIVGRMTYSGNEILGYATFPGTVASQFDGVVVEHDAFGRIGTLKPKFNKGRTATHEVGHWLNLYHIWGGQIACTSDFCGDTPPQDGPTYGDISSRYSCSNDNMVMNYLDYTNDAYMNIFTIDQKDRMRANVASGGERDNLISLTSISGSSVICSNATFSVPTSIGTVYTWNITGSGSLISGQGTNSIVVAPSGSGSITISVRAQGLCISRTIWAGKPDLTKKLDNDIITISSAPVAPASAHTLTSVTNSPSGSTTFNKIDYAGTGDIVITMYNPTSAASNLHVFSGSTNGYRQVKMFATNACGTTEDEIFLYLMSFFKAVYPNPAKDYLTIEFNNLINKATLPDAIELYQEESMKRELSITIDNLLKDTKNLRGSKYMLDIKSLKRGIWYLHGVKKGHKTEVVRLLFE